MSLSDLAALGSFVSGFAVLVSLVFLYFQMKQIGAQVLQAEKNQRASIRTQRATRLVDNVLAATEPSLVRAIRKGNTASGDLTDDELNQFNFFCLATAYNWEDGFYQHKDGLLDDDAFATFVNTANGVMTFKGRRAIWKRQRAIFHGEFLAFVDKLVAEVAVTEPIDALASFRADADHEKTMAAA